MKCENCLHYETCGLYTYDVLLDRTVYYKERDLEDVENRCFNFADMDLYIKLPCKVGTFEIHKAAIEYYSAEMQENQCIEECAELIQAINKKHRGRAHNISEEIADVEIYLEQLKIINNCADEVERYKTAKMKRLKARITK